MFIKTIVKTEKKTGKRYEYYRLCEGYRIGNKVRHRTIISLGKLQHLENKEDRKILAGAIETILRGEVEMFPVKIKPELEKYANEFARRIIDENLLDISPKVKETVKSNTEQTEDYQEVNLNSLEHTDAREIGAEWLCKQTIDKLDLYDFLINNAGFNPTSASIAIMHIISRAVFPASEHKTVDWLKNNTALASLMNIPTNTISRYKLYNISQKLYQQKDKLENFLSTKTNELFDIEDKIIFYDLTNTYFEGRKEHSKIAKFGRSKEKRSDAKIVALAAVINAEGFLKYSKIYQGNIGDSKTLEKTINDLSSRTSTLERKPVIVMDAGIMTEENATMLKSKGYDYIAVSRTKLKEYTQVKTDNNITTVYDKRGSAIELKMVTKPDCDDKYMYVKSEKKALKETSMNERFSQQYEEELEKIQTAITKKGGVKKLEKVWERIGRLKERYPSANNYYKIEVIADDENKKATNLKWERIEPKPRENAGAGVYFIRTSLDDKNEKNLWTIYNTLTEIEATFRVLKTDLSLRPVYHKTDDNIEAHLFLGLLAYQLVATIRYQLKQKNINDDWRNIVRKMNTQKEITSTLETKNEKKIYLKKCSKPNVDAKQIYEALDLKHSPYVLKKSVVPL